MSVFAALRGSNLGFFLIQRPYQCTPVICKILRDLLHNPFFLAQNVQISYILLITLWMRVQLPSLSLRFTMASAITLSIKVHCTVFWQRTRLDLGTR